MGGTFDVLHRGHRALLETAFAAGDEGVFIGVTSDAMAQASRSRKVRPHAERKAALERWLDAMGWLPRAEVAEITDPVGRALEPAFDAIVATRETARTAEAINASRAGLGLAPLEILIAPWILADDGRPVSATRVRAGEVDVEGRLQRPARVAVGSENPVKVAATAEAWKRAFGGGDVRGVAVKTDVPEQPFNDETWRGAESRARAALEAAGDFDFGVGIEAGLVWDHVLNAWLDVQACVVVDRAGRATRGHGPGFEHPPFVLERALRHGESVGDALGRLADRATLGREEGAVGFLSRGALDRTELTTAAVLAALLPRLRPELYGL